MGLIAFLLACAGSTPPPPPPTVAGGARSDVDIEQLEQALKGDVLLLDVRTKGEFMGGHVEGAINTPMPVSADHPVLAAHNRTDPVYVICESGGRSGRMADHLSKAGFQTLNITGGTRAWRQAGKPVSQ